MTLTWGWVASRIFNDTSRPRCIHNRNNHAWGLCRCHGILGTPVLGSCVGAMPVSWYFGDPCFGDPGSPIYRYNADPSPTTSIIETLGPYLTGSLGTPSENRDPTFKIRESQWYY